MDKVIAEVLPYGIAVALSPMPVAALILMLLSKRARVNSVMFLVGWTLGLFLLVITVSYFLTNRVSTAESSGISPRHVIDGALGVFLILFAIKQWVHRPKKGQVAKVPKWMAAVVTFSPAKAFGVGFLLATVNFKNTPMGIAVGTVLSHAGSQPSMLAGMTAYLLVGGITILLPVAGFLLFGNSLKGTLFSFKNWLIQNNSVIMFFLFLILGVFLIGKAFNF
jgi:threonine/homoserine/homoserine lactone efflux protein